MGELAETWNNPDFNPVTEIHDDLHSNFYNEIELTYANVKHLHPATPEYVEKRVQGIIIDMGLQNGRRVDQGMVHLLVMMRVTMLRWGIRCLAELPIDL